MVQLPETTGRQQLGTIAEIGKERLRRAVSQMKKERAAQLDLDDRDSPEDLGFRVFKLRPSNYRQWSGVAHQDPDAYAQQMEVFTDPLVDGWTTEDVLWEVALKEGLSLSSRVEGLDLDENRVWRVTDEDTNQGFLICLDDAITPDTPAALGLSAETLFICRDVALTDELAANLALQCRLKTI